MQKDNRPVLNPILALKREPRRDSINGRGLSKSQIKHDRLEGQRVSISKQISEIGHSKRHIHAGRVLVSVKMFDDSLAPSYEPEVLFCEKLGGQLVAPVENGYLAQIHVSQLEELAEVVKYSDKTDVRVIVSRIEHIRALQGNDILRQRSLDCLWNDAIESEGGRVFTMWLAPYFEIQSRESVVNVLLELQEQGVFSGISDLVSVTREPGSDSDQLQFLEASNANSLLRAIREYRQKPFTKLQFILRKKENVDALIACGGVFRIEPVRPFVTSNLKSAPDPDRPIMNEVWQPVVGVVDGGLFARSYESMVAWRAPSLVSDIDADRVHGNHVSSLIIQGAEWNTHLDIPTLHCRIGVAQAISKTSHGAATRVAFRSYLHEVISRHCGDTKVWNFSFSEPVDGQDVLEMSELGHEIHKIAREFNILPVISIGNTDKKNTERMNPPADCEAALTVGGRVANGSIPGAACPSCLPGPGPEGLMKPEVSWFSTLKGIGGCVDTGSSYATAITSAIAAHTFHNLKSPTPDLVRALLINTAELEAYDRKLGFGSPFKSGLLPWECSNESVTLVWSSKLRAGEWYYWEDIPIPPELVKDSKLFGRVSLTAILNPLVSELGSANYFSTRLQVALQYSKNSKGDIGNLAGSMREDIEVEQVARTGLAKWNPIRHHCRTITRGLSFSGNSLRVCARVFGRDLYQHGIKNNSEIGESSVAFALTLSAPSSPKSRTSIYDSVAARLGAYVDSAVNDTEISVRH